MSNRHERLITELRKAIYEIGWGEAWDITKDVFKKELHQEDNNIAKYAQEARKIEEAIKKSNQKNNSQNR